MMNNCLLKILILVILLFSLKIYACGNNPNAIVQGPFKDHSFDNGSICFQNSLDRNHIDFYLNYMSKKGIHNDIVDTFYYSDAPVELMSVFFEPVNNKCNVVVLLRWNVNYEIKGIQYLYYYEIKTYQRYNDSGYKLNLDADKDEKLAGYQTKKNGKVDNYPLDNAQKIKRYLRKSYST
ncbi:hypothetical protein [Martelella alba]|uniref:Lipoprotein n=1 Tax=Martelella alba TaxID=2590451 RepID=A0ABY2SFF3_9HYPH|nr:hypothetical protein [Martelella alba]TKI03715.1 hypothetical protein FCN80_20555 [Martelella alba]